MANDKNVACALPLWSKQPALVTVDSAFDLYGYLSNQSKHTIVPVVLLAVADRPLGSNVVVVEDGATAASPPSLGEQLCQLLERTLGARSFACIVFVGRPDDTARYAAAYLTQRDRCLLLRTSCEVLDELTRVAPAASLDRIYELPSYILAGRAALWHGDGVHGRDAALLSRLGVRRTLNVTLDALDALRDEFAARGIVSMHVNLPDHPAADVASHLDAAVRFVAEAHSQGHPVLVHCEEGKSRSTAFVLGYLVAALRWPLRDAFFHVLSRRPLISPNNGFMAQLVDFERRQLGQTSVSPDYFADPWGFGCLKLIAELITDL